jgi:hypothetical protein
VVEVVVEDMLVVLEPVDIELLFQVEQKLT